jgi:ketosteroid isomerase-like protein
MDAAAVADRLALHDLALAYAATADRRDVEGFTALFLPDATLTARRGDGEPAVYQGTERLAEIPARLGRYRETFHVVTNHRCEVTGDIATGEAACRAHHVTDGDDGATDVILTIRYRDTYRRTDAGWRFATRDVHILWSSEEPVALA